MCGRYDRHTDAAELAQRFGASWHGPTLSPSYNVAPTQEVPAIRERQGSREAVPMRWGLIPPWAKDKSIGNRLINARAEGIADKPAYRAAFRRQRCLLPADGFYEWKQQDGRRQPYYLRRRDGQPLAFAGLWARWQGDDETIESCTIITTQPNALVSRIHSRMPVVLMGEAQATWLESDNPLLLERLLQPLPADVLTAYPVSRAVNSPAHEGPDLITPLPAGEDC